jgi:S-(hydroxymethyl)glutathione dehydrogenase/alcohol dehydrogenase
VRAVVLRKPGDVRVEEVELTPPQAGEVLVRIAACGVCHSDLQLADGRLGEGRWPMVLGHEGAGIVEAVGAGVVHVSPGDRVVLCMIPSCGSCSACRAGRPTLCGPAGEAGMRGTMMDGTSRLSLPDGTPLQHGLTVACFAERVVVAAAGVVPLTVDVPLWQAALLGCGAVTGIGAVRNVARPRIGERAAVVGCGGVGQQVIAGNRNRCGAQPGGIRADSGRRVLPGDAAAKRDRGEERLPARRSDRRRSASHRAAVRGWPRGR